MKGEHYENSGEKRRSLTMGASVKAKMKLFSGRLLRTSIVSSISREAHQLGHESGR